MKCEKCGIIILEEDEFFLFRKRWFSKRAPICVECACGVLRKTPQDFQNYCDMQQKVSDFDNSIVKAKKSLGIHRIEFFGGKIE